MPLSAIITAPITADSQSQVSVTGQALQADNSFKLFIGDGEVMTITKNLPYDFTINYADSTTLVRAVSLDESSNVIISEQNANWLYDSNGELLFDSNSLLLEGA